MQHTIDHYGQKIRVPKFRSTQRALLWIKKHDYYGRLPAPIETIFFTSKKENPQTIALNVAEYARTAGGRLPVEFENLLLVDAPAIFNYYRHTRVNENRLSETLENALAGHDRELFSYANNIGRLPKNLEDSLTEPRWAYEYAVHVLRGRLPEHLEQVFFKDIRYAAKYAFDVIRGFAPVKLPEALHNFVLMKSFENPNDSSVKTYIEASESDPNRIGNTRNRVH